MRCAACSVALLFVTNFLLQGDNLKQLNGDDGTVSRVLASTVSHTEPCPPQTRECTIMMPEMVTEMRTITVCDWRAEQRQETYMACRMVPETREVPYEYTVPTYETRTREFVYSVFKPVLSSFNRDYTVMVPYTEKRQGVRSECRMVPVEMTCTVCEDHGAWRQMFQHDGCGCCGSCSRACRTWIPKLQPREIKYTVMRPEMHDVPYEYEVTLCHPEKRTETVQVCNYVAQPQTRSVPYTVCVPVTKTGIREITCYHRVEEPATYTYTVQVPYSVEKQVPVQVCRMVAKKVTLPAGGCEGARWCGKRCW
jgi:hypothetical protein